MGWDTSAESYGAFLHGEKERVWAKSYVNHLPIVVRNNKLASLRKNGPTTNSEYGTYFRERQATFTPKYGQVVPYRNAESCSNKLIETNGHHGRVSPSKIPVRPELVKLGSIKPLLKKETAPERTSRENRNGVPTSDKVDAEIYNAVPHSDNTVCKTKDAAPAFDKVVTHEPINLAPLPYKTHSPTTDTALAPVSTQAVSKIVSVTPRLYGRSGQMVLPDIKRVDMQFVTHDNDIVSLQPAITKVESVTYPRGLRSLHVPDIREMSLSFDMKDGSRVTMRTLPHPRH